MNNAPKAAPFTIRVARRTDYPAILEVWQNSRMHVHTDGRESEEAFAAQLAQFPGLFFVAESEGAIVGVVLGSHDHRKGWINRLAVLPAHQRRGIGAALVATCETALRTLDLHVIAALVETTNLSSASVFERQGYDSGIAVRYFRKSFEA